MQGRKKVWVGGVCEQQHQRLGGMGQTCFFTMGNMGHQCFLCVRQVGSSTLHLQLQLFLYCGQGLQTTSSCSRAMFGSLNALSPGGLLPDDSNGHTCHEVPKRLPKGVIQRGCEPKTMDFRGEKRIRMDQDGPGGLYKCLASCLDKGVGQDFVV